MFICVGHFIVDNVEPERVDRVELNPNKYKNERYLLKWDISKLYNRIFYTSHEDKSDLQTWIEGYKNAKVCAKIPYWYNCRVRSEDKCKNVIYFINLRTLMANDFNWRSWIKKKISQKEYFKQLKTIFPHSNMLVNPLVFTARIIVFICTSDTYFEYKTFLIKILLEISFMFRLI